MNILFIERERKKWTRRVKVKTFLSQNKYNNIIFFIFRVWGATFDKSATAYLSKREGKNAMEQNDQRYIARRRTLRLWR